MSPLCLTFLLHVSFSFFLSDEWEEDSLIISPKGLERIQNVYNPYDLNKPCVPDFEAYA